VNVQRQHGAPLGRWPRRAFARQTLSDTYRRAENGFASVLSQAEADIRRRYGLPF
jgi:hypothetical protein